jgi:hypothetical protein
VNFGDFRSGIGTKLGERSRLITRDTAIVRENLGRCDCFTDGTQMTSGESMRGGVCWRERD